MSAAEVGMAQGTVYLSFSDLELGAPRAGLPKCPQYLPNALLSKATALLQQ